MRGLCDAFKSADEAAGHGGDQEMFRSPPAYLTLKFRRRTKRYGRQDSFGMDDAVASPCADGFNTIFVNRFHSVLLERDGGRAIRTQPTSPVRGQQIDRAGPVTHGTLERDGRHSQTDARGGLVEAGGWLMKAV